MSIYLNNAFKLELKFEEGWKLTNWSEWKKKKRNIERYKDLDKDFPSDEVTELRLFSAYKRIQGSPNLMSRHIYVDAYWKEKDINIKEETLQNDNEVSRLFTTEDIIGMEWPSVKRNFDVEGKDIHSQFFTCNVMPNIWLYATVVGDTKNNFEAAKKQFLKISKLKFTTFISTRKKRAPVLLALTIHGII